MNRHCLRLTVFAVVLALTACGTTPKELKYDVLILNESGEVIEDASLIPMADAHSFEPKRTKVDGMVDLNDVYSQRPTSIVVRASGYKTQVVPWSLPSETPLTVTMKRVAIPGE